MLTIENQLHTRIENGKLDKIELIYISKEISETYNKIKTEMTKYFEDNTDKEMLVQWRGQFENKIKEFHDEQVEEVKRKLDELLEQKKACKTLDDQKTEFEKLFQQSKDLAQQLKDEANYEKELENQFNLMWSDWVEELTEGIKPLEDINLKEDQFIILKDLGIEMTLIEESKSSEAYRKISEVGYYKNYICLPKNQEQIEDVSQTKKRQGGLVTWFWKKVTGQNKSNVFLPCEEQKCLRSLINNVEKQTVRLIKSKPVATRGYTSAYLQEMAKNVIDKVTIFKSNWKFALKKEFKVDLLLHVFDRAESWLLESHRKFRTNNDARTFVESQKSQYYNIFRSFCRGNSSAVVFGEVICKKLKVSCIEAICNKTAMDLAGEMRCSFPAFNGNRLNLEKHVLKSLAEKENFDDFMTYINDPRQQVENFIKEEVRKYIFTENKDKAQSILQKNVDDIRELVSQALFTATDKVKTWRGNTDVWLKEFSGLLTDELRLDTNCSQNFRDINNFDFLKEEVEKGLTAITEEMRSLSLEKMETFRLQPDQILIDQLCSCCWVKCPFCAAACTKTPENHDGDHSVPFHRSTAINGFHYRSTVEMSIEFCTTQVASDGKFHPHHDSDVLVPNKQYRTAGPRYANWSITPDGSNLPYWEWVVCRFQRELENHYNLKFKGDGKILSEWRKRSKEEVIKSLDEMCNM